MGSFRVGSFLFPHLRRLILLPRLQCLVHGLGCRSYLKLGVVQAVCDGNRKDLAQLKTWASALPSVGPEVNGAPRVASGSAMLEAEPFG